MPRMKRTYRRDPNKERATPTEVPASEVQPVRHGRGKEPLSSSIAESLREAAEGSSPSISWTDSDEERRNVDATESSRPIHDVLEEDISWTSEEDT